MDYLVLCLFWVGFACVLVLFPVFEFISMVFHLSDYVLHLIFISLISLPVYLYPVFVQFIIHSRLIKLDAPFRCSMQYIPKYLASFVLLINRLLQLHLALYFIPAATHADTLTVFFNVSSC